MLQWEKQVHVMLIRYQALIDSRILIILLYHACGGDGYGPTKRRSTSTDFTFNPVFLLSTVLGHCDLDE